MSAILLSGCGGSDVRGTDSSHTPTRTTTDAAPVIYETPAVIAAAVHACMHGAEMAHWLPTSTREQLDSLCEQGRKSGLSAIAAFAREVCDEVAFTSPLKSASEKEHVLAECQARVGAGETAR